MLVAEVVYDWIRLWDVEQPNSPVQRFSPASTSLDVEFHPDGERLAVALKSGGIEMRKVKTGRLAGKLQFDTPNNLP
jgi:WD40 repeat protein